MISSLVAGTDFGTVLIWAIVVGALLKFALTEGIGRWYMASGETILKGWHMLGPVGDLVFPGLPVRRDLRVRSGGDLDGGPGRRRHVP